MVNDLFNDSEHCSDFAPADNANASDAIANLTSQNPLQLRTKLVGLKHNVKRASFC